MGGATILCLRVSVVLKRIKKEKKGKKNEKEKNKKEQKRKKGNKNSRPSELLRADILSHSSHDCLHMNKSRDIHTLRLKIIASSFSRSPSPLRKELVEVLSRPGSLLAQRYYCFWKCGIGGVIAPSPVNG